MSDLGIVHSESMPDRSDRSGFKRSTRRYIREDERLVDLVAVRSPGTWHREAACRDEDPELFEMKRGGTTGISNQHPSAPFAASSRSPEYRQRKKADRRNHDNARAICSTCPVASECLSESMVSEIPERSGLRGRWITGTIRAGFSPAERSDIFAWRAPANVPHWMEKIAENWISAQQAHIELERIRALPAPRLDLMWEEAS